jgi:hypothetical protein
MSVWLTIPSARPPAQADEIMEKWRAQGYKIALWVDSHEDGLAKMSDTYLGAGYMPYTGYAQAVNGLIFRVMQLDPSAEWFVIGGDDTLPDPNHTAQEIADQCHSHLAGLLKRDTFGVMQPTGDRWHEGVGGFTNAPIDRVAGSAWIGKLFAKSAYGGSGPLFPGYQHMFVDEELQAVAKKLGVFWQRRDLIQKHMHWGRGATDSEVIERPAKLPPHLEKWNTPKHWRESKQLFEERKAAGFPGHEPLC